MRSMTEYVAGGYWSPDATDTRRWAMPNKAHAVAVRLRARARERGRRMMPLPPEELHPGVPVDDGWCTPRAGRWDIVADRRVLPAASALDVGLTLRDYQREALTAWWTGDRNGVIEAPCGAGKTAIGVMALAKCPTQGLVLVHTRDLLRQWIDRAAAVGVEATGIMDGKGPVEARVVVATMQTLATWDRHDLGEWGARFGLVIVDEAHHCPCDTLTSVMYQLPGRWRLGLTATPKRQDGLSAWMHGHLGPTVAQVSRSALLDAGAILAPRVVTVHTGWAGTPGADYGPMVTEATKDEQRNGIIIRLARSAVAEGRQVMIQTERKEHADTLATLLRSWDVRAVAVTGDTPEKRRREALARVASGDERVLCVTQLGDEGLDLPGLSCLILGVPQKNPGALEQRVGRVARPAPGKTDAIVYDLVDDGEAAALWWARKRVYQRMMLTVEDK